MAFNPIFNPKIRYQAGFTLMELMIVVAIIGILIAIAVPSYRNYTRRAHYTEIVQAAAPYKIGVEECFQTTSDLAVCQAGEHGIPPAVSPGEGTGLINQISVGAGQIIITPQEKYGITVEDTYELIPKIAKNTLVWTISGGGVTHGYAH